jgi:peptidoglycan L-alanyl-D-glutamate endopeptidase CwlK
MEGTLQTRFPDFPGINGGEAMDCFWVVEGKAEWSTRKTIDDVNGYKVYAEEAVNLGLEAGGYWSSLKDWTHIQLRPESNPGSIFTIMQISDAMKQRFET